MSRKPIKETAMEPVERRRKSDAAKVERGEMRIITWVSPEAAAALRKITKGSKVRGEIKSALEKALLSYVRE